jgi:4-hydroxy-3-polyprenylbenzoate decarboxylase
MIVAPASMRTVSEIASGAPSNLLTRAADVCLKERRRLVLMARETPLHVGHLKAMLGVTEMGGVIFPPVPAFYDRPANLEQMVDHTIGRVLDLFDLEAGLVDRWEGRAEQRRPALTTPRLTPVV